MPNNKNYTPEQDAILFQLREEHARHLIAKSTLRAEIEAAFRDRLRDFEYRKSVLMNKAVTTVNGRGKAISKSDVAKQLGTMNQVTLNRLYAIAADEYAEKAPEFWGDQITYDEDTRLITTHWLVDDSQKRFRCVFTQKRLKDIPWPMNRHEISKFDFSKPDYATPEDRAAFDSADWSKSEPDEFKNYEKSLDPNAFYVYRQAKIDFVKANNIPEEDK